MTGYSADNNRSVVSARVYTADELSKMTVAEIKSVAAGLGYSIKKVIKADVIAEFLAQQEG